MVPDIFTNLRRDADTIAKGSTQLITLDEEALDSYVANQLNVAEIKEKVHRVHFPLKFDNNMQELNFHAVHALLDFGSAYEPLLNESVHDKILFGLIGLHLTKQELSTGFLMTMTRSDIATYFGIDPMEKVQHESIPVIEIERPGPLSDYVNDLVRAFTETGERLKQLGESDLGRFILTTLRGEEKPSIARLVTALNVAFASTFGGAFVGSSGGGAAAGGEGEKEGRQSGGGGHISFAPHKKALCLAGELYHRLRDTFSELQFADFNQAPGYATSSSLSLLVKEGILKLSNDPQFQKTGSLEEITASMYANTILAIDQLANKLGGEIPALDLAYWLDQKAREEESKLMTGAAAKAEGQKAGEGQLAQHQAYKKYLPPKNQLVL